jgi:hypothetical protein
MDTDARIIEFYMKLITIKLSKILLIIIFIRGGRYIEFNNILSIFTVSIPYRYRLEKWIKNDTIKPRP